MKRKRRPFIDGVENGAHGFSLPFWFGKKLHLFCRRLLGTALSRMRIPPSFSRYFGKLHCGENIGAGNTPPVAEEVEKYGRGSVGGPAAVLRK